MTETIFYRSPRMSSVESEVAPFMPSLHTTKFAPGVSERLQQLGMQGTGIVNYRVSKSTQDVIIGSLILGGLDIIDKPVALNGRDDDQIGVVAIPTQEGKEALLLLRGKRTEIDDDWVFSIEAVASSEEEMKEEINKFLTTLETEGQERLIGAFEVTLREYLHFSTEEAA